MQQETSQRATDGLQPEHSDTQEFQAEGREGGKVPGGREALNEEGGSHLWFVVKRRLLQQKGRAHTYSGVSCDVKLLVNKSIFFLYHCSVNLTYNFTVEQLHKVVITIKKCNTIYYISIFCSSLFCFIIILISLAIQLLVRHQLL